MHKIGYYLSVFLTAAALAILISAAAVWLFYAPGAVAQTVVQEKVVTDTMEATVEESQEEPPAQPAYMDEPKRRAERDDYCGETRISHPSVGITAQSEDGHIRLTLIDKR